MRASSRFLCVFILSASGLVLAATPSSAQAVGAKGGLDLTYLKLPEQRLATEVKAKPGVTGGGFVRIGSSRRLGLQGEVLISRKRQVLDDVVTHTVTFLEVPVFLRYRAFGLPGGRAVHAYGGGFFASVLSATEKVLDESLDLENGISSSDLGAVLGGEVALMSRLSVDARYVHGTKKIYNTIDGAIGTRWSLQFMVAYRLFGK